MSVVQEDIHLISPTHYGVAEFVHKLFKDEYKCKIIKKSYVWFHKEEDGSWKKINEILVRNRLSTDVVNAIALHRHKFKNTRKTQLDEIVSYSKSLEPCQLLLGELNEKKKLLIDQNKIQEIGAVDTQIRELECTINMITKKQKLEADVVRDRVFSEYAEAEGKLYNSTFKNGVMKELAGFFYLDE
jgi:hypothetical protein